MSDSAKRFNRMREAYERHTGNPAVLDGFILSQKYIDWIIDRRIAFFGKGVDPFSATPEEYNKWLDWLDAWVKTNRVQE